MKIDSQPELSTITQFFQEKLDSYEREGLLGAARFKDVYESLLPVQQRKIESLCSDEFTRFLRKGSILSIGVAYYKSEILSINKSCDSAERIEHWNEYAWSYDQLNQILNSISKDIADEYDGIAVTATLHELADKIDHVTEYYPLTISHRVVAEFAGLGWRGKNGLLINEEYSCALRFTSVMFPYHLEHGFRIDSQCGECNACETVCPFIKHRDTLPDYRENCRRYIISLKNQGLTHDVCGKCIKACLLEGIYSHQYLLTE